MARKMRPELVALSTGLILSIYGAGYRLTQTTASASAPHVTISAGHSPAAGYRDGTYSGTGSNYLGDVSVAVSIKAGKITQVQITACNMHYPESWIDGLPAEVTAAQSTNIDVVSGATASSAAFLDAVTQALAQAGGQSGGGAGPQTGGQTGGSNSQGYGYGFSQGGGNDYQGRRRGDHRHSHGYGTGERNGGPDGGGNSGQGDGQGSV
ncbi:MAG: FMN-binding protein [Chloroflexota bacterium]